MDCLKNIQRVLKLQASRQQEFGVILSLVKCIVTFVILCQRIADLNVMSRVGGMIKIVNSLLNLQEYCN